jgi:hypothetical protein
MTRYTQAVESVMMGIKNTTASSMIQRVKRLEEASHTVRLARGSMDEGIMKGNRDIPRVSITPVMEKAEARKASR